MNWARFQKYKNVIIGIGITTLSACAIFLYYLYGVIYPSTENAYVNANLINVAPKVGGYIEHLYITNNQRVKKGDLLISINPIDFSLQLQQAKKGMITAKQEASFSKLQIDSTRATLEQAESDYKFSQQMAIRYTNLYQSKAGSLQNMQKYVNQAHQAKQALDAARSGLKQAETHYELANTQIAIAKLNIENAQVNENYTKLYAPVDGYISNLNLQEGQLVAQGQKLFGLIDDAHWWVDVNLKETQLSRIKKNQKAKIRLDMYGYTYHGTVQSISYASGSTFSLLPMENATGNWVKITQYFTVRVALKNNPDYPLRVGASAHVKIYTLNS